MKEQILNSKITQVTVLMASTLATIIFSGQVVHGQATTEELITGARDGVNQAGTGGTSVGDLVDAAVNILVFSVGILSVIMVIVGAVRYVTSAGDAQKTEGARNTILYALIGLGLSFVAWGIVEFVVDAIRT